MTLSWKIGFEIELMAPAGRTRADLAHRVARRVNGQVSPFFHPQSEPSKVPGRTTFENLTPGFAVEDDEGRPVAAFVDDLTLQAGLDRQASPLPGWYRVIADDGRLLRLVMRHCDAGAPLEAALVPLAQLFGTVIEHHPGGMVRVVDDRAISVAIGAPLPGERERPCEIVTAPIAADHAARLTSLLDDARAEGFSIPKEGATHLHFDAQPLLSARTVAALVDVLWRHGPALKRFVGANPNCVRLGLWPETLPALTQTAGFQALDWPAARAALAELGLIKYCDFNLLNMVTATPSKHTFEVRILPVSLDAAPTLAAARLFEAVLRWACNAGQQPGATPRTFADLLERVGFSQKEAAVLQGYAMVTERSLT